MAIRGVSLEVQEDRLRHSGANGAGKTTILKTIMTSGGPTDKGTIEFLGKRIDGRRRGNRSPGNLLRAEEGSLP